MTQEQDAGGRRKRITRPYPSYTLADALVVANAIYEVNAGLPFDRELLAGALGTTPKSSAFTTRLNASAAYGLTEGGYNDADILLTELGEAVVAPGSDVERRRALAAAAMNPDIFGRFYELFDGRRLPQSAYLRNILQRELGVRANLVNECLDILQKNGEFTGIVSEADGQYVVSLPETDDELEAAVIRPKTVQTPTPHTTRPPSDASAYPTAALVKRIFIGHIGESDVARYVSMMLEEFGIASASPHIPEGNAGLLVPQEVSEAIRECSAAILVFPRSDDARHPRDKMLGLLGAASVLFSDRVVILQEAGAQSIVGLDVDGLKHIDFDDERPEKSGLNLLVALHKAGVIKVSA